MVQVEQKGNGCDIIRDPETGEDICTSTRNDPIECLGRRVHDNVTGRKRRAPHAAGGPLHQKPQNPSVQRLRRFRDYGLRGVRR